MKRFIAVLSAAAIMLSFAACKKNSDNDGKNNGVTDGNGAVQTSAADASGVPVDGTTVQGETEVPATDENGETIKTTEDKTGNGVQNTTGNGSSGKVTAPPKTNAGTRKPSSKAEVVAYFNKAANSVKTDKPGYTCAETPDVGKITSDKGFIEKLVSAVMGFFKMSTETTTVGKGASHANFPVKGQSWSSKLDVSAVKSAVCNESGGNYVIKITMNDESLKDLPTNPSATKHGKAFNVLSASEVYEQTDKFKAVAKVKSFAPTYTGCYIECTVNKSTGKMTKATYYFKTIATIDASAFLLGGDLTATVPFGIKQVYTIHY